MSQNTLDLRAWSPVLPTANWPRRATRRRNWRSFPPSAETVARLRPQGFAAGSAAHQVQVQPGGKTFATITEALNSITDASLKKQYVCYIGPGTYAETVTCKPWVFLQGDDGGGRLRGVGHRKQADRAGQFAGLGRRLERRLDRDPRRLLRRRRRLSLNIPDHTSVCIANQCSPTSAS